MKFGIVIFPSKSMQDKANSFRKRYDPHYALIPPHITLKSPFDAAEEKAREIAQELDKVSDKIKPFTLKIGKVSSFTPVNNVI
jgi:2'-5' RNA ligase